MTIRILTYEEFEAESRARYQASTRAHPDCTFCRVGAKFAAESLMFDLLCINCRTIMRWHSATHPHPGNAKWVPNTECAGFECARVKDEDE